MLGLLARFTDIVHLPAGWNWMENGWVILIIGVLLVGGDRRRQDSGAGLGERLVQTFVRPAAGGIVFGSGTAAPDRRRQRPRPVGPLRRVDPGGDRRRHRAPGQPDQVRRAAAANVATAGVAAPVLSTVEDVTSFGLVFIALLVPILVLVILAALIWSGWRLWRKIQAAQGPTVCPADRRTRGLAAAAARAPIEGERPECGARSRRPADGDHATGADRELLPVPSTSTPTISPGPMTTFCVQDRAAHHRAAAHPDPGHQHAALDDRPVVDRDVEDNTELRTDAAEMMLPAPTTDSCAEPPLTNLAGARFSVPPRIGQRRLYRLNTGCTDTRSMCAS